MESQVSRFLDTLERMRTPGFDLMLLSSSEQSNFEVTLGLILEKSGVFGIIQEHWRALSKNTVSYVTDLSIERDGAVYEPLDEILLRDTTLKAAFPSPQLYDVLHELYFGPPEALDGIGGPLKKWLDSPYANRPCLRLWTTQTMCLTA